MFNLVIPSCCPCLIASLKLTSVAMFQIFEFFLMLMRRCLGSFLGSQRDVLLVEGMLFDNFRTPFLPIIWLHKLNSVAYLSVLRGSSQVYLAEIFYACYRIL